MDHINVYAQDSPQTTSSAWSILLTAFLGAFFAFLFTSLLNWLNAKHERGRRHQNALVRAERLGEDLLNDMISNRRLSGDAVAANTAGHIFYGYPGPMAIDQTLAIDILDVDLVNRVAAMNTDIARYNRDVERLTAQHGELQQLHLSQVLPPNVWGQGGAVQSRAWTELRNFLDRLEGDVCDIVVRARLLDSQYNGWRAKWLRLVGVLRTWPLAEEAVARGRADFDTVRQRLLRESREANERARRIGEPPE